MKYNGPWTAPSAGVYGADGLLVCSLGGRDVVKAFRKRGDTDGGMVAKYARVAAAAPELLEALKDLVAFMGWSMSYVPSEVEVARAVIDKAEGR